MLSCAVMILIYVIVAAIFWYVIQEVLKVFWTPPPPVMHLIGLLIGLLVLLAALNCLGVVEGGPFIHHRVD